MQRDMDLVRQLMLKLEALPLAQGSIALLNGTDERMRVDGYTPDQVDYHLSLLADQGWIEVGRRLSHSIGFRKLTPSGHDFVDSVRDPEIWRKTKEGALAVGGITFDLLKDLAKGFIKKQIEARTGINL
jgi:hypothetical protein